MKSLTNGKMSGPPLEHEAWVAQQQKIAADEAAATLRREKGDEKPEPHAPHPKR